MVNLAPMNVYWEGDGLIRVEGYSVSSVATSRFGAVIR
jgi:hypothetical protein